MEAVCREQARPVFHRVHVDVRGLGVVERAGRKQHVVGVGAEIGDGVFGLARRHVLQHFDAGDQIEPAAERLCNGSLSAEMFDVVAHLADGVF